MNDLENIINSKINIFYALYYDVWLPIETNTPDQTILAMYQKPHYALKVIVEATVLSIKQATYERARKSYEENTTFNTVV